MKKLIINFLILLMANSFFCCTQNNDKHANAKNNDSQKISLDTTPKKPKTTRKLIDFRKLYGTWLPISMHDNGDTDILSFLPDTLKYDFKNPTFKTFDSLGHYEIYFDDYGESYTYKIDSQKCELIILNIRKKGIDTISHDKIIYLNNKYLLWVYKEKNKKYIHFLLKTKMKAYLPGGG